MKISVIGTGYVGLVTGVGLALKGHTVTGVDNRESIIEQIKKGNTPIHENGLEKKLKKVLRTKQFSVSADINKAIQETDITFVCVGTPSNQDGSIDLAAISKVSEQIGCALKQKKDYHTVVVKSTVLPTTTVNTVGKIISEKSEKKIGIDFGLAMNPEFLKEGSAVLDFLYPDRIIIGSEDAQTTKTVKAVYKGLFNVPILEVSIATAEMIKYTNNAFLALCISFSNEIAQLCEHVGGIDAVDVLNALAEDGRITIRIGKNKRIRPSLVHYLFPGCGFGGSCFPKDLKALSGFARSINNPAKLVDATLEINKLQILETVKKVEKILGNVREKSIAILGTAFKQDTDDIRESPALVIIDQLLSLQAKIKVYDPQALNNTKSLYQEKLLYAENAQEALKDADLAIIITRWDEFKQLKPEHFKKLMRQPIVLDCRRIYNKKEFSDQLEYYGIGIKK